MSSFQLIELAFDPEDTKPTLEDELTLTVVGRDIDKLDDVDPVSYTHLTLPTIYSV